MIRKLILTLLLPGVFLPGVYAQPAAFGEAIPADTAVRTGTLPNGMRYYIRHNAKPAGQGEFFLLHNVGAMQEETPQIGLAHFLEHMAFNGTKNFPGKGLTDYLETIGVKFGANLNASTGQESTVYNISGVPLRRPGITDTALLILHDWSHLISLDSAEIDKERGVIIEEFRTGNTADRRIMEKVLPVLFNGSRYGERNVIGNLESLKSFPHRELRDFYRRWYRPDLQAVVIVGDFDADSMETKLRRVMADIPPVQHPEPKAVVAIPDNAEPLVAIVTDPEQTQTEVSIYIKRPPLPRELNNSVGAAKIGTMLDFVETMASYRLAELARQKDAPFIQAGLGTGTLTTTCDVTAGQASAREGEALRALEALYTEMERIRREGFTPGEFARTQSDLMRAAQSGYDSRDDRYNGWFVQQYLANYRDNDPMPDARSGFLLDSTLIGSLTLDELNRFVPTLFSDQNRVVILTAPEKTDAPMPSEAEVRALLDRIVQTEVAAYRDSTVQEPLIAGPLKGSPVKKSKPAPYGATEWTLANGIRVVVLPTEHKADEILFSAESPGGLSLLTDAETPTGEVLSTIAAFSGAGKFSALELEKQLAGKQVTLSTDIGRYTHSLGGGASPKDAETLLQLIYLYSTSPRFNRDDYELAMDKYRSMLKNAAQSPQYVLQDSLTNTVYGHNPRRQILSPERLEKVDFEAMPGLYGELFGNARNFTFVFTGKINLETFRPLVEKYIGSLPVQKQRLQKRDNGVRIAPGRVQNRFGFAMETPKTTVVTLLNGPLAYSPENRLRLNALKLLLDMRYTATVREEKGGTYGVATNVSLDDFPVEKYGLQISFDTDPAQADTLMELITGQLQELATDGPTPEELSKVKQYLTKQRTKALKENGIWLSYVESYYSEGIDFNARYDELLEALDADQIRQLAATILAEENLIRVVMEPARKE